MKLPPGTHRERQLAHLIARPQQRLERVHGHVEGELWGVNCHHQPREVKVVSGSAALLQYSSFSDLLFPRWRHRNLYMPPAVTCLCVCLRRFPALVSACVWMLTTASLCNTCRPELYNPGGVVLSDIQQIAVTNLEYFYITYII